MSNLRPVSRVQLISRLRELGFEGPFTGGRHEFMRRRGGRIVLPNPHRREIGVALLARILRQASVSRREWLSK